MSSIKIIGLTGQSGAGKSSISKILKSQGFQIIDCDVVARSVADEEMACLADLALEFSINILNPDASLNRKALATIVFGDAYKLKKLNAIIFPYIKARISKMVSELSAQKHPLVILDAPTLFESGLNKSCDYIVSVIAPESLRLNRIMIRDHLTDDDARKRIASQHTETFFVEHSNYIIENTQNIDELHLKTLEMVESMCRTFLRKDKDE